MAGSSTCRPGREAPYDKNRIVDHLPEFVDGVLDFARREGLRYDVIHSHYWLSGLAARDLRRAWGAPIVQMFHTLGQMKNSVAASPQEWEPERRIEGEAEVMAFADRLVAATPLERAQMVWLYGADASQDRRRALWRGSGALSAHSPRRGQAGAGPAPRSLRHPLCGAHRAAQRHRHPAAGHRPARPRDALLAGRPVGHHHRRGAGRRRRAGSTPNWPAWSACGPSWASRNLVTFLGAKDQDTLVYYYSAAEMVVMPSHYESFGMVALEAMACGTPVVASKVGGLAFNVQDGQTGFLVPDGDAEALADKIRLLLTDQELRRKMGRQAAHWAGRYGWPAIADQIRGPVPRGPARRRAHSPGLLRLTPTATRHNAQNRIVPCAFSIRNRKGENQ